MKKNKMMKRALSLTLAGIMVLGTGMTAFADEKPVPVTDVQWIDQDVKENMDTAAEEAKKADDAAKAADQAAKDAQAAADALDKLVTDAEKETFDTTTDEKGNTTVNTVTDSQGQLVGDLNDNIETPIKEAESTETTINDNITNVVTDANKDTAQADADAKAKAEAAAEEAKKAADAEAQAAAALAEAQAAADYATAQAAADKANAAYADAQTAADNANQAVVDAEQILLDAQNKLAQVMADLDEDINEVGGYQEQLDAKKATAQAAIDEAKALVDAAETAYETAKTEKKTAEDAAKAAATLASEASEAAAKVGTASGEIDSIVKAPVEADIAAAKAELEEATAQKEAAIAEQQRIEAEENEKINAENQRKAAAQAVISGLDTNAYNQAKNTINQLEDSSILEHSDIYIANQLANCQVGDWSSYGSGEKKNFLSSKRKVTAEDIRKANETINQYNAAVTTKTNYETTKSTNEGIISSADAAIQASNTTISNSRRPVTEKTNVETSKQNALNDLNTYLATFNYTNSENAAISYLDKENQEQYQKLLADLKVSSDNYNEIYNDTELYKYEVSDLSILEWLDGLLPWNDPAWKNIERKYRDWTVGWIYVNSNGTNVIFSDDHENTQVLINIRDDRASVLELDEAEYASFSAAFDKTAAAQASQKAADAAQAAADAAAKEKEAADRLTAAKAALKAAQDRLNAVQINTADFAEAKANLEAAKTKVDNATIALETAQDKAETAQEEAEEAQRTADSLRPAPATPDTPSTPATTPVVLTTEPEVVEEEPAVVNTAARAAVPATVDIPEEDTALADAPEVEDTAEAEEVEEPVTDIEEEPTALAVTSDANCMIHWIMVILTLLFAAYEVIGAFSRTKKNLKIADVAVPAVYVIGMIVLFILRQCQADVYVTIVGAILTLGAAVTTFVQYKKAEEENTQEA